MKTAKVHRLAHVKRDRGYRFVDRDPDMEWLCNRITATGRDIADIVGEVSRASGGLATISPKTIACWMSGKTRRPQNHTLTWVAYALGVRREWVELDAPRRRR